MGNIFGYNFIIQNVYPYESTPLSIFRVVESWIFVHGYEPLHVRSLAFSFNSTFLLILIWEIFETFWEFGVYFNYFKPLQFLGGAADWLGGEKKVDSLIGDISQGLIAAAWSSMFLRFAEIPSGKLWYDRTFKQKLHVLLIYSIMILSAALSTVIIVIDPEQPLYFSSIEDWKSRQTNIIPIGWYIYFASRYFFLFYLIRLHIRDFPELEQNIITFYSCTFVYLTVVGTLCSTFWIPTYYTFYLAQIILVFIFYFKYYYDNPKVPSPWEIFKYYWIDIFGTDKNIKIEL